MSFSPFVLWQSPVHKQSISIRPRLTCCKFHAYATFFQPYKIRDRLSTFWICTRISSPTLPFICSLFSIYLYYICYERERAKKKLRTSFATKRIAYVKKATHETSNLHEFITTCALYSASSMSFLLPTKQTCSRDFDYACIAICGLWCRRKPNFLAQPNKQGGACSDDASSQDWQQGQAE